MITVKRILLAITQTRDGRIQLITSKDHCRGRGVIRSTPIHHGPQNAPNARSHELKIHSVSSVYSVDNLLLHQSIMAHRMH